MVGNWLYFVGNYVESNSIRYRQNEHNKVTYGAIYRVYIDQADGGPLYEDAAKVSEFPNRYTQHLLDTDKYHLVVPKVAGFETAALWVFGEHLVYTSPNNSRDRRGVLQTKRIDFFRVDLDGRNHRRLYTTTSDMVMTSEFTVASFGGEVFLLIKDGDLLRRISVTERPGRVTTISKDVQGQVAFPVVASYREDEDFPWYSLEASYDGIMGHIYYTEGLKEEERKLGLAGVRVFQYDVLNDTSVDVRILNHSVSLHGLSNGRLLYTVQSFEAEFSHGLFALSRVIDDEWKAPFSENPVGTGIKKLLAGERWNMRNESVFWQTENAPNETFFRFALVQESTMQLYESNIHSSSTSDMVGDPIHGVEAVNIIRVCRQFVHYVDASNNFAAVLLDSGEARTMGQLTRALDPNIRIRPWVVGRNNTFWHFFIRQYTAEAGDDDGHDLGGDETTIAMLADLWSSRHRDFENQFVFILGRLDCQFLNNPEESHDGCCDK